MRSKILLLLALIISLASFSQPALYWDRIHDSTSSTRSNILSVITDRGGNIYLLSNASARNGSNVSVLTKYDQAGNWQWNAKDSSIVYSNIITDNNGYVYLCGQTNDTGVNIKAALSKYSGSGNRSWTELYNGGSASAGLTLLNSTIYTTGSQYVNGKYEMLILGYDLSGGLQVSKLDSLGDHYSFGSLIQTDGTALYVIGQAGTASSPFSNSAYITKYTQAGTRLWLNKDSFPGLLASRITVGPDSNIYFTVGYYNYGGNKLLNKIDKNGDILWRFEVPSCFTSPAGIGGAVLDSRNNIIIGGTAGCAYCGGPDPSSGAYLARLRPNGDTVFQYFNTYCSQLLGYAVQDDNHILALGQVRDSTMQMAAFDSLGHMLWSVPLTFLQVGYFGGIVTVDSARNIILGLASEYYNPLFDTSALHYKVFVEARKYGSVLISGIEEIHGQIDMRIFPNPAKDQIHVQYASGSIHTMEMMTPDGKKINIQPKQIADHEESIDVSKLARGIYLLHIDNGLGQSTYKVILE